MFKSLKEIVLTSANIVMGFGRIIGFIVLTEVSEQTNEKAEKQIDKWMK